MSRVLGQMSSKDPLWSKLLCDFILWCWKVFGSSSVTALGHKHFEGKLCWQVWLLSLWGIIWVHMFFLVNNDQFTSKIYGRLRRLPQYSSESVTCDFMAHWPLVCGWQANQSIFQGVLICMYQRYWFYCNHDSWFLLLLLHWSPPHPVFFPQPFSITVSQKPRCSSPPAW